jgi:cyclopropane fatty-acyl-phospholipid synthase-like methyltransferase
MATVPDDPELARWNTRFSAEGFVFGTAPNAFLAAQRERLRPGMRALCVADGEGRNGTWLAQQGLEVTAFDFSLTGIAKAKDLARSRGVEIDYRNSDADDWNWDAGRYDIVAAIFVQFAGPALRKRMFDGMMRALERGGLLLLQGYRPEQLRYATGGPKQIENLYTEALLRESFSALEILHLSAHDDVVDEGHGHKGMSALIDMVARST